MQVVDQVAKFRTKCSSTYLSSFNELFDTVCLSNYKSAFVHIPLACCFLILGIVCVLHWKPFGSKTLKKPEYIFAYCFSLILVALNVAQVISIIIPMINPNDAVFLGWREKMKIYLAFIRLILKLKGVEIR